MTPSGARRAKVVDQVVCAEAAIVAARRRFDFHVVGSVIRSNATCRRAVVERFAEALALVRSGSVAWLLARAARRWSAGRGCLAIRRTCPRRSRTREAHIPAQHPSPSSQARLSCPHAHTRRQGDHQVAAAQGPHSAVGLIWRIRGRRAFQTLARSGRTTRTETLWCTFLNDPAAVPLRVAFAVGRSVGPATRRNRLRRQLRAIVASIAPDVGLDHGWLLIGATPTIDKHTFESLRNETTALLTAAIEKSTR
jgi:ribonuclease P protein component